MGTGQIKLNKDKTCLIRLSETENISLDVKAQILGIKKSKLLRDGAFYYWNFENDTKWSKKLLSIYKASAEDSKNIIVDILFEFYRRTGYPHNTLSKEELIKQMQSICKSKTPLLPNNHLQINTVGLALPNHFHPHMVKVRCRSGNMSPYELYQNDVLFKDAIKRWLDLDKKPSMSGMRRILRTRDGVRSVVNFKPTIAKYIYDTYCPHEGSVLDPCSGYGGRLAGCIASNKGLSYHGIDPDGRTAVGNMQMASLFSDVYAIEREFNFGFKFDLGCAEDVLPSLNSECYDCIFTSPPYFDIEKYSTSPNQSYKKFDSYDKWRLGFLLTLVRESSRIVRPEGKVIINVKNYDKKPIADDVCVFAENCGLKLHKTYQMRLSNSEFNRRENESSFHSEPIFIFSKL